MKKSQSFYIEEKTIEAFKNFCLGKNINKSEFVEKLIIDAMKKPETPKPTKPTKTKKKWRLFKR